MQVDNMITIYKALGVVDGHKTDIKEAYLAMQGGDIIGCGSWAELDKNIFEGPIHVVDYAKYLIFPALVNAHTHLNLTQIGQQPYPGSFPEWLGMVMGKMGEEKTKLGDIIRDGAKASLGCGVAYVGDITPGIQGVIARREAGLKGVSFIEYFGIGENAQASAEQLRVDFKNGLGDDVGIEPHAPYSAGRVLYEAATALQHQYGAKLTTHLAETLAEIEFTQSGTGDFSNMLKRIGKWDDSIVGSNLHPVDYLQNVLRDANWVLAHCNYVDDSQIEFLASTDNSVAYCPVASDYFQHSGHRYREMLDAGINVCLGTDSIICQSKDAVQPYSIFDQMRHLYLRDGFDSKTLLRMGTSNGLQALGLAQGLGSFEIGADRKKMPMELACVQVDSPANDPLASAMNNRYPIGRLTEHLTP